MIFVDSREGSGRGRGDLTPYLKRWGLPHQVMRLEFGDVVFAGVGPHTSPYTVAIEIKTIHDLIKSFESGRLMGRQIPEMTKYCERSYLIIEGEYRQNRNGELTLPYNRGGKTGFEKKKGKPMRLDQIEGFLATAEEFFGVRVRKCNQIADTALMVKTLYLWWSKEWSKHRSHLAFEPPMVRPVSFTEPTNAMKAAGLINGLGWERAEKAAKRFKTVEEMVKADEKEWTGVNGVGKELARRAYEFWRI